MSQPFVSTKTAKSMSIEPLYQKLQSAFNELASKKPFIHVVDWK